MPPSAALPTGRFSPRALLSAAGFAVVAGVMCGIEGWGESRVAGLGLLTLGLALGIAGVARSGGQEEAATQPAYRRRVIAALMLLHVIGAVYYCHRVPADDIDCYTFQRAAIERLVHGIDPFGKTQANLYTPAETGKYYGPGMVVDGRVQVGLQYPPLTLAWILSGYMLGDIRYSYILAIILSGVILFGLTPGKLGFYLTAFLLLDPLTFLMEDRCWTEPLVLLLLSCTVYAAYKNKLWLPVALGLFLASKQYNFLALPFLQLLLLPFSWRAYWKLLGGAILVALATVVPFAIWDLRALLHDLVLFHLAQPFRWDSLSFAVVSPIFLRLGPLLVIAFAVWCIRRRQATPAIFAAAYGLALLLFVVTSKQAFVNYYFLVAQALFLAAGSSGAWIPEGVRPPSEKQIPTG
jgi:hypothetical protein